MSSPASTTKEDETGLDEQVVEIDLVAEEVAIRAEHQALVEDINSRDRDPNIVTAHWLERGSVLMSHNFFGELVSSKSLQKIRGSWKVVFKRRAPWPMKSEIETLSIDEKRGQTARIEGLFEYQSRTRRPFKALYQKNKEGKWFNYIKGNQANNLSNLDVIQFSTQGIGRPSVIVTTQDPRVDKYTLTIQDTGDTD